MPIIKANHNGQEISIDSEATQGWMNLGIEKLLSAYTQETKNYLQEPLLFLIKCEHDLGRNPLVNIIQSKNQVALTTFLTYEHAGELIKKEKGFIKNAISESPQNDYLRRLLVIPGSGFTIEEINELRAAPIATSTPVAAPIPTVAAAPIATSAPVAPPTPTEDTALIATSSPVAPPVPAGAAAPIATPTSVVTLKPISELSLFEFCKRYGTKFKDNPNHIKNQLLKYFTEEKKSQHYNYLGTIIQRKNQLMLTYLAAQMPALMTLTKTDEDGICHNLIEKTIPKDGVPENAPNYHSTTLGAIRQQIPFLITKGSVIITKQMEFFIAVLETLSDTKNANPRRPLPIPLEFQTTLKQDCDLVQLKKATPQQELTVAQEQRIALLYKTTNITPGNLDALSADRLNVLEQINRYITKKTTATAQKKRKAPVATTYISDDDSDTDIGIKNPPSQRPRTASDTESDTESDTDIDIKNPPQRARTASDTESEPEQDSKHTEEGSFVSRIRPNTTTRKRG